MDRSERLFRRVSSRGSGESTPLPMLVPDTTRGHIIGFLGEFVGTFFFLFFSFTGTQMANTPLAPSSDPPNPGPLIFIALAFGVALTVNVWAFYRITGGLFNPVVTLALTICRVLTLRRALWIIPAQFLGALVAAAVVSALFPSALNVDTVLGGGTTTAQGLFIEMFLTAQFVFVILMLAVEKHRSTFLAPIPIGATFFLAELVGVYFTGGSLNPFRSFGPAVVNRSFPGYHWIYWLGPVMGSLLGCAFYKLLTSMRYQDCNPGQDSDGGAEKGLPEDQRRDSDIRDEESGGPSNSADKNLPSVGHAN